MLGDPLGAFFGRYGSQSATESRTSSVIVPLNFLSLIVDFLSVADHFGRSETRPRRVARGRRPGESGVRRGKQGIVPFGTLDIRPCGGSGGRRTGPRSRPPRRSSRRRSG